jgi:hypothetical protein
MGFNRLDLTVLGMKLHDWSNQFLTLLEFPESVKLMDIENPGIK